MPEPTRKKTPSRDHGDNRDEAFYGVARLNEALEPIYDHYVSIGLEHLYQPPGQTVFITKA